MAHPGGRPTLYNRKVLDKARKYFEDFQPWYECPVTKTNKDGSTEERMERVANPPPSMLRVAEAIGVDRSTVFEWVKEKKEFSDLIKKLMPEVYSETLQENAMMGKYSAPFAIFAAKNRLGWTDKAQLEHSGTIEHIVRLPAKKEEGSNVE